MSYIKKTLTADEKIIIFKKTHWIFWLAPAPLILFFLSASSFIFLLIFFFTRSGNLDITISLLVFAPSFVGFFCYFIKYISVENAVTNKRIIFKTGFIKTDTDELRIERLENIQIKQSIFGRIFRYGELEFKGTGGSPVMFKLIADPISTKKEIENFLFNK